MTHLPQFTLVRVVCSMGKLLFLLATLTVLTACADKNTSMQIPRHPGVVLTCVAVLPSAPGLDLDNTRSVSQKKNLKNGVKILDNLLGEELGQNDFFRFVSGSHGKQNRTLDEARKLSEQVSCNAVLEVFLDGYRDRVGSRYSIKTAAAVSFAYSLYEVEEGKILCQGRFDEEQQSVMENLYNWDRARGRGFTWVTAEELLHEGLKEKLAECDYFSDS